MFATLARRDYRHWPTREAVTLVQGVPAALTPVPVAMRGRGRAEQEQLPSGGQYLASDLSWQIPGPVLPAGAAVVPGDVVRANKAFRDPAQGTVDWVALQVSQNPVDEVWTVDCVALRLNPGRQTPVQIQRPQANAQGNLPLDAAAAELYTWATVYPNEPAAVVLRGRPDATVDGQVGSAEDWLVVLSRTLEIATRDRVLVYGTAPGPGVLTLDIVDVQASALLGELQQLVCVRQP
jgi:hypothetical protein